VNDSGRSQKGASCRLEALGYIAAHTSTRDCGRAQELDLDGLSETGPNPEMLEATDVLRLAPELGH
jgi:hypothetical protein